MNKLLVSILFFFLSITGNSATVNSIYSGSVNLTGTSTTVSLCDSVDLTSSILVFSLSNNSQNVGECLVRGRLTNETTITFNRDASGSTAIINWKVIYFSSGVSVQRGNRTINSATVNQSISAVSSLSNSFVILNMQNNGSAYGDDDGVIAELTSTTNLQFRASAATFDVDWQVVEYDSCVVQPISISLSGATATGSLTAVDVTKTMIIGTHYQSGSVNADDFPRTELTNSTTVTLTRNGTASTITYFGYAVEFTDRTSVQHGSFSLGAGESTKTATITAVQTDRSVAVGTGQYFSQGSTNFNSNDNIGYNWGAIDLDNSTTVSVVRAQSSSAAVIPFQVISFAYNQTIPPSGISDASDPPGPFGNIFLNRIEKGSATIAGGSSSTTISIAPVDRDSSFLVFSVSTISNAIGDGLIQGRFTNDSTLTFARDGNGSDVNINYQILYFREGVYVQHGNNTINSASQNIAINAVDLSKSFVIFSFQNNGSTYGEDDGVVADLTTSTNLQIRGVNALTDDLSWQVIQMEDALVRKINFTHLDGFASLSYDITSLPSGCGIGPVNGLNLNRSFLVSSHTIGGTMNADDLPRILITDTNEVTVTRVGSSSSLEFVGYVVELFDGSVVESGEITISGAAGSNTASLTRTNEISTAYFGTGNVGSQGSSNFTTDDQLGYNWVNFEITDANTFTATRANTAGSITTVVPYQAIEFINFSNPPLPVNLIGFSAEQKTNGNLLRWQTSSELNSESFSLYFTPENEFKTHLVTQPAAGYSNQKIEYQYFHKVNSTSGAYTLQQKDKDGTEKILRKIWVTKFGDPINEPLLFPNPAQDCLRISNINLNNTELLVFDMYGKQWQITVKENSESEVVCDVQNLSNGIYVMVVRSAYTLNSYTFQVLHQ